MFAQPPILVCGATCALGSRIVRGLVEAGIHTRALVRPQSDAAALEAQGVEVVRGDLRDRQSLEPAVANVATIVSTAGPEAITRIEDAEAFASAMGRPIQRRHIPRAALRIGSLLLRRAKPELASSMAMGLAMDSADSGLGPQAFTELGIEPRSVRTYIAEVAPTLPSA